MIGYYYLGEMMKEKVVAVLIVGSALSLMYFGYVIGQDYNRFINFEYTWEVLKMQGALFFKGFIAGMVILAIVLIAVLLSRQSNIEVYPKLEGK